MNARDYVNRAITNAEFNRRAWQLGERIARLEQIYSYRIEQAFSPYTAPDAEVKVRARRRIERTARLIDEANRLLADLYNVPVRTFATTDPEW